MIDNQSKRPGQPWFIQVNTAMYKIYIYINMSMYEFSLYNFIHLYVYMYVCI
jgi:hypothetical protein